MKLCVLCLLTGCAAPASSLITDLPQTNHSHIHALDLANRPQDSLILEQILLAYLEAGTYDAALEFGLKQLDPQLIGQINLRLLIQAARQDKQYSLAHELIRLGQLIYPNDPAFLLEERLLKLAEDKCSYAVKPIQDTSLSFVQKQIFEQIKIHCSSERQANLTIAFWLDTPPRTTAKLQQFMPEENSFIDQTCTVFAVGCGPIRLEPTQETEPRIYGQAIWHLHKLRRDWLRENIRVLFQKNHALRRHLQEDKVFAQYQLQIDRNGIQTRPMILFGVQTKDINATDRQHQTYRSATVETDLHAGNRATLTSSLSYAVTGKADGEVRSRNEKTGIRLTPHEKLVLSYEVSQDTKVVPHNDIRGPSGSTGDMMALTAKISDSVQIKIMQNRQTEQFERTLYYLTSPHQIKLHKLAIRMDISLKMSVKIWIEGEHIRSRSDDPVYDFKDARLALGFSRNL